MWNYIIIMCSVQWYTYDIELQLGNERCIYSIQDQLSHIPLHPVSSVCRT